MKESHLLQRGKKFRNLEEKIITYSLTLLIFIPLQFTTSLTVILISSLQWQHPQQVHQNLYQSHETKKIAPVSLQIEADNI